MIYTIFVRAAQAVAMNLAMDRVEFAASVTGGNAGPQRKRSGKQRNKHCAKRRAKGRR